MLRRWVFGLGCCLLAAGVLILLIGRSAVGLFLVINGLIIVLALSFERARYKRELNTPPGPGWVQTGEKSMDETGIVCVWFNPSSGERAYVRAGPPPR